MKKIILLCVFAFTMFVAKAQPYPCDTNVYGQNNGYTTTLPLLSIQNTWNQRAWPSQCAINATFYTLFNACLHDSSLTPYKLTSVNSVGTLISSPITYNPHYANYVGMTGVDAAKMFFIGDTTKFLKKSGTTLQIRSYNVANTNEQSILSVGYSGTGIHSYAPTILGAYSDLSLVHGNSASLTVAGTTGIVSGIYIPDSLHTHRFSGTIWDSAYGDIHSTAGGNIYNSAGMYIYNVSTTGIHNTVGSDGFSITDNSVSGAGIAFHGNASGNAVVTAVPYTGYMAIINTGTKPTTATITIGATLPGYGAGADTVMLKPNAWLLMKAPNGTVYFL